MKLQKLTRVIFALPGAFVSESSSEIVTSRDPFEIDAPKNAFSFYFTDTLFVEVEHEGEMVTLKKGGLNRSVTYYPEGKIFNLEEIKNHPNATRVLISNMTINQWPLLVETRLGNFQPFNETDLVIYRDTGMTVSAGDVLARSLEKKS